MASLCLKFFRVPIQLSYHEFKPPGPHLNMGRAILLRGSVESLVVRLYIQLLSH